MKKEDIKEVIKKEYGEIAKQKKSCCNLANSCCGNIKTAKNVSKRIGYTDNDISTVPKGANLGLGCGNPIALASLKEGEVVLDLGSGAGFDTFLAANKVGDNGKVIGIDITPEMIEKARENAEKGKYKNVEFRLGEINNLPVADSLIDVVISNCVINLVPDKKRVFKETFRVLKSVGRLMVSDIVLLKKLPYEIINSIEAYIGCVSGAIMKDEYIKAIEESGFEEIRIISESAFSVDLIANREIINSVTEGKRRIMNEKIKDSVVSISIFGIKPKK